MSIGIFSSQQTREVYGRDPHASLMRMADRILTLQQDMTALRDLINAHGEFLFRNRGDNMIGAELRCPKELLYSVNDPKLVFSTIIDEMYYKFQEFLDENRPRTFAEIFAEALADAERGKKITP